MKCKCDRCEGEVRKQKFLKKIKGERLCFKCYTEQRRKRREELINEPNLKQKLKELDSKYKRISTQLSVLTKKKINKPEIDKSNPPIPKGSIVKNKLGFSYLNLGFRERQSLFRILIKRGMEEEEAVERLNNLEQSQRALKLKLRLNKISDDEAKNKHLNLMEGLLNF